MSIAYQAVVIFALILPGIIFRNQISAAGQFRQQRSLSDELAHSVMYAFAWHAIWIFFAGLLAGWIPRVSLKFAFMHAMGQFGKDSKELDAAVEAVTNSWGWVFLYFASISICAGICGRMCRACRDGNKVRWLFGWVDWIQDHEPNKNRQERWSAFLQPHEVKDSGEYEIRFLTMIVELGKAPFLFVGILEDVSFGPDGNPETYILSNVSRRALLPTDRDPEETLNGEGMHDIEGDMVTIRASEAKTLNMVTRYIEVVSAPDEHSGEGENAVATD